MEVALTEGAGDEDLHPFLPRQSFPTQRGTPLGRNPRPTMALSVGFPGENAKFWPEGFITSIKSLVGRPFEYYSCLVVFHNVVSMTRVLQELVDAGYVVTPEIIGRLSPYKTEHINRFGHYELRFDHVPPPVTEELRLSPASTE